eukprot:800012-Rhodomonas_salina.1
MQHPAQALPQHKLRSTGRRGRRSPWPRWGGPLLRPSAAPAASSRPPVPASTRPPARHKSS